MIQVTLKLNKECAFTSPSELKTLDKEFLVITGESGVTDFRVTFPESLRDWAKRVEFYNAKDELDIQEFEGYEKPLEGKLDFDFSLPDTATAYPGYARLVFRASHGDRVFVWNPEPIPVTGDTFFRARSESHPDLLSAAYETARAANQKAAAAVATSAAAENKADTAVTASASALEIMEALVKAPDNTEANTEGAARVEVTPDGRLKFISIKGVMPKIQIGQVTAVKPDEAPEVVIRADSPPEAPVLDIKLPKGVQGPPGSGVAAGMSPVPVYKADWVQDGDSFKLEIGPDKHHLGATNIITAEANIYMDGTTDLLAACDSPVKTSDGIVRLYSRIPWEGVVLCSGGSATAIDAQARGEIAAVRLAIENESHFRGYVATPADVRALPGTANDYAYCAQDSKVWVHGGEGWAASSKTVPDQMVPKGMSLPLVDGEAAVGDSNTYADALHRHPTDSSREPAFTKNTAFNKNFGTVAGTVCEGNDPRLTDSTHITSAERAAWNAQGKFVSKATVVNIDWNAPDWSLFDSVFGVEWRKQIGAYRCCGQANDSTADWGFGWSYTIAIDVWLPGFAKIILSDTDPNLSRFVFANTSLESQSIPFNVLYGSRTKPTAADVGLSNVENVRQYSDNNIPHRQNWVRIAPLTGETEITYAQLRALDAGMYTVGGVPIEGLEGEGGWWNLFVENPVAGDRAIIAIQTSSCRIRVLSWYNETPLGWYKIYTANEKPTAADVGALSSSGGDVNGTVQVKGTLFAYRYANEFNAPALLIDKPGPGICGIGSVGENNVIQFGPANWDNFAWDPSIAGYIFRFLGEIYENGVRVYSPNNPPPVVSTAPYVRTVQPADWVADSQHGYHYEITAAAHGKGVNAFAQVFTSEGYSINDFKKDFSTGAFTVFSRSSAISVRVEIRG